MKCRYFGINHITDKYIGIYNAVYTNTVYFFTPIQYISIYRKFKTFTFSSLKQAVVSSHYMNVIPKMKYYKLYLSLFSCFLHHNIYNIM